MKLGFLSAIACGLIGMGLAALSPVQAEPAVSPNASLEAEVEKAKRVCRDHSIFRAHQNCECIGERFREARLRDGTAQSLNNVLNSVGTLCPDRAAIAAYRYGLCLENIARQYPDFSRERHETFCACVAKDYAERYVKKPINSIRAQTQMQVAARVDCGSGAFLVERSAKRKQLMEQQKSGR